MSPNTIKKAVNELRQEGLVETVPQKGSFVAEPAAPFVITLNHTDLGEENAPGRGFGGGEGKAFVAGRSARTIRRIRRSPKSRSRTPTACR